MIVNFIELIRDCINEVNLINDKLSTLNIYKKDSDYIFPKNKTGDMEISELLDLQNMLKNINNKI